MKKFLLLGMVILMSMNLQAQTCGSFIDLYGMGIDNRSQSQLSLNWENVEFVVAEAVYKSTASPILDDGNPSTEDDTIKILFSSGDLTNPVEEKAGSMTLLESLGTDNGLFKAVFRAEFTEAASQINLDVSGYEEAFYSFAIYVYRKDGSMYTLKSGELVHVYHNETVDRYEREIQIPTSTESRDLRFRFGITELNKDNRLAIFSFEANGTEISKEVIVNSYDESAGHSYLMQEVILPDVPGNVSSISFRMLSKDPVTNDLPEGGDSFIAGIVLIDLPCETYESELLCSFTQGFYGNEGGKMCGKFSTPDLLEMLMKEKLVMGIPGKDGGEGNSLTIDAGNVQCILDLLPGGGPSAALSGYATCENLGSIPLNKKGRIKNSLLAQGITLTLNTRLPQDLLNFPVDGTEFVTLVAEDCFDPEAGGIPGTEKTYAFSPEIVEKLHEFSEGDPTIKDLLHLVNMALGGENVSPLSLSQISDAATLVNEAFDECVVVVDYAEIQPVDEGSGDEGSSDEADEAYSKQGGTKGVTGTREYAEGILDIYPNPALDYFNLKIPSSVEEIKHAAIYSLTGAKVMDIEQPMMSGVNQVIEVNVSHLNEGIYFVRIETAAGIVNERFGVQ